MIMGIPLMIFNYREQIMKEIDKWLENEDKKRDKRLDKQARGYLSIIKNTDKKMKRKGTLTDDVKWKIHKMREYVNTWKWLPWSYQGMLRLEFIEQ